LAAVNPERLGTKASDVLLELVDEERNVYEPARLYEQNRRPVDEYVTNLQSVDGSGSSLRYEDGSLVGLGSDVRYPVRNGIADFIHGDTPDDSEWQRLNESFLRYHRSLSPYTLLNSGPLNAVIAEISGIGGLRDASVIDVGGGTGHVFCSFFQHPETLDYYLVDPNVRLLHDQFIRVYPRLIELQMAHILGLAERLPFKDDWADVVMSLSSIDHFTDYHAFIAEAGRVLRPGGKLLISSHLDPPAKSGERASGRGLREKLLSPSLPERIARYIYYRRYRVGRDDHTFHFPNPTPIEDAVAAAGLRIDVSETIKRHFCIVAIKP
jgi:ubiquinone/menaquinone biosynthesis C-methylase UbiE